MCLTPEAEICCHGDCMQGRTCPLRASAKVVQLRAGNKPGPFIQTNTHRPVIVTPEQCAAMDDTMPAVMPEGKTFGSKLADFIAMYWYGLPITTRLAVENAWRRVNWWGLFVLCMCLLSCALMTIGIFGATGTDLSVLTDLLGFR